MMTATTDHQRVLVTGASGFLATHIVQQLQSEGYQVRGTVRSLTNEVKIEPLRELCPSAKYPLELVEANLSESECWKNAVKDCHFVIHVASPVIFSSVNEDEIIKPAVDGTLNVLRACQLSGTVKRVVLTSSVAAIANMINAAPIKPGTYSEKDWNDAETCESVYFKSKILAEKSAWEFMESLSDKDKFELVAINPTTILGPILSGSSDFASLSLPKKLLDRKSRAPALLQIYMPCVDVRDVAQAHLKAMVMPDAAGKRFIVHSEAMWMADIAAIVKNEFESQGYNVPFRVFPNWIVRILSYLRKEMASFVPCLGIEVNFDNQRMKNELGIKPRDLKTTMVDMCYSAIEKGIIEKTDGYKSPTSQHA